MAEKGLPLNAKHMTREMQLSANDSIEHQREGSTPATRFMSPSRVFESEGDNIFLFFLTETFSAVLKHVSCNIIVMVVLRAIPFEKVVGGV